MRSCACVLSRFSRVPLYATPWTVAHQAPLSMGFSRQEYWCGLPCPPPGIFPPQGLNPGLLCLLHWLAHGFFPTSAPWKAPRVAHYFLNLKHEGMCILQEKLPKYIRNAIHFTRHLRSWYIILKYINIKSKYILVLSHFEAQLLMGPRAIYPLAPDYYFSSLFYKVFYIFLNLYAGNVL